MTSRDCPVATSFCFRTSFAFLIVDLNRLFLFFLSLSIDHFCSCVCLHLCGLAICPEHSRRLRQAVASSESEKSDTVGLDGGEPGEPSVSLLSLFASAGLLAIENLVKNQWATFRKPKVQFSYTLRIFHTR